MPEWGRGGGGNHGDRAGGAAFEGRLGGLREGVKVVGGIYRGVGEEGVGI